MRLNDGILNSKILVSQTYNAQINAFGMLDYPFLVEIIQNNNISKILDVGTGDGQFIVGLSTMIDNLAIDAIEINEELVDKAKIMGQNLKANVNFKKAKFDKDFDNTIYDLIVARFAVEHITNLSDISTFISSAFSRLSDGGLFIVIEYYIHNLDIIDPIWKKFRFLELETYKKGKVHPRICLQLPELFYAAGFQLINSKINHISPEIIGPIPFFNLIQEYVNLYSQIFPDIWCEKEKSEIINWCKDNGSNSSPVLFTSYTIGQKPSCFK